MYRLPEVVKYDNIATGRERVMPATRPISWICTARKAFDEFPEGAKARCLAALTIAAEDVAMKQGSFEVIRGSGNAFRDLDQPDADVQQFKALLAAEIIKKLDRDGLTVREAHARTGIAAADFSRIRNADLGRFTLDRLVGILNRLGSRVEIKLRIKAASRRATAPRP